MVINEVPNEVPDPIRLSQDRVHASYDVAAADLFWRVVIQQAVSQRLPGKGEPGAFFLGWFRPRGHALSGRTASLHCGGMPGLPDAGTREAYSHEVGSAGYWPGHEAFPQAAFYTYTYPEPPGFRSRPVSPGAYFEEAVGLFILPYEVVRASDRPDTFSLCRQQSNRSKRLRIRYGTCCDS